MTVNVNPETDKEVVERVKGDVVDGTVTVDYSKQTQEDKTDAVQDYVDNLIKDTGTTATVTHKSGNTYTVEITKGTETTSKDITMTVNVGKHPDVIAVETAKEKLEDETIEEPTDASDLADEKSIEDYIKEEIKSAIGDDTVDVEINKVSYKPATNGTKGDKNGTDGAYKYTVTIGKGNESQTTTEKTFTIPAESYYKFPILSGDNQTPTVGTNGTLTFTSEGEFDKFLDLYLNDVLVSKSNYTVSEGSTIITLNADYVRTLPLGEKDFMLEFKNGYSVVNMEVVAEQQTTPPSTGENGNTTDTDNPQTSENSNAIFFTILELIAIAGIIGFRKKLVK